jgi:hypothetical protein
MWVVAGLDEKGGGGARWVDVWGVAGDNSGEDEHEQDMGRCSRSGD